MLVFAVALRRPVDFFLTTTRDIRRWIFDSRILFCWTEKRAYTQTKKADGQTA